MIRVLIVDDQEMIRVGLRTILQAHPDIEVVAEAGDGLLALRLLETTAVDVVLMDLRMPGIDGVEATSRLRARWPAEQVRVLVLTTFEQDANGLPCAPGRTASWGRERGRPSSRMRSPRCTPDAGRCRPRRRPP